MGKNIRIQRWIRLRFLNHRLFGSIDGYYRYTKGALAPSPYPLESGSTSYTSNLIDLSNKGVEIEIGGDIIRTPTGPGPRNSI